MNLPELLKPLAAALITLVVAYWIGRTALAPANGVRRRLRPAELDLFALALGAAILSNCVYLLGLAGALYDLAFWGLAVCALAVWLRWGRAANAGEVAPQPSGDETPWRWLTLGLGGLHAPYLLANALAPEVGPDSLGYHLGLVARYYRAHALVPVVDGVYGFLSQGTEMLYLFSYALGRADAPKIIHFVFFLATLVALVCFGRRFASGSAGWIAAGLFGFSSVVQTDATMAYNDCTLAFYALLVLYALLLLRSQPTSAWMGIAGALAGFCFALKYTGAFALLAAGAAATAVAFRHRRTLKAAATQGAVFGLAASLFILPWVGRNWIVSGNPVAPFYNRVFPNPYVTVSWERRYRDYLSDYSYPEERAQRGGGSWNYWGEPALEVALRGERLGGMLGPALLLAPPLAALGLASPIAWPLAAATTATSLAWFSNAGTRFLIPPLAFFALCTAIGITRLPRRAALVVGVGLVGLHGISNWVPAVERLHPRPAFLRLYELPWRAALRIEPEVEYRSRIVHHFRLVQALKKTAPPGSRVLSLNTDLPEEPFAGEILFTQLGTVGEDIGRDLMMPLEQDFQPTRRTYLHWTPAIDLTGLRIDQTATKDDSWWAIAELRPTLADEPFGWPADWKVGAEQLPRFAPRLIDGDPLTMWRSWRPLEPGRIELTGSTIVSADGFEVLSAWGQHFTRHEFELRDEHGQWAKVEPHREIERLEIPAEQLRRRPYEALRRNRIEYIVADLESGGHNWVAEHIDKDPAAWGLETAWAEGSERIYRVVP